MDVVKEVDDSSTVIVGVPSEALQMKYGKYEYGQKGEAYPKTELYSYDYGSPDSLPATTVEAAHSLGKVRTVSRTWATNDPQMPYYTETTHYFTDAMRPGLENRTSGDKSFAGAFLYAPKDALSQQAYNEAFGDRRLREDRKLEYQLDRLEGERTMERDAIKRDRSMGFFSRRKALHEADERFDSRRAELEEQLDRVSSSPDSLMFAVVESKKAYGHTSPVRSPQNTVKSVSSFNVLHQEPSRDFSGCEAKLDKFADSAVQYSSTPDVAIRDFAESVGKKNKVMKRNKTFGSGKPPVRRAS